MLLLYRKLVPSSLGLSKAEAGAIIESAKIRFKDRGYAWIWPVLVLIVASNGLSGALHWFVNLNGWPEWIATTALWVLIALGLLLVFWINPRLGLRRAVFAELIERGYQLCPKCGYHVDAPNPSVRCPECGACPQRERWDQATLSMIERVRFRHQRNDIPLPFDIRRAVIGDAWEQVRASKEGSRLCVICWVLVPLVAIGLAWEPMIGLMLGVPLIAMLFRLEWHTLRPAIQREVTKHARSCSGAQATQSVDE